MGLVDRQGDGAAVDLQHQQAAQFKNPRVISRCFLLHAQQTMERQTNQQLSAHIRHAANRPARPMRQRMNHPHRRDFPQQRDRQREPLGTEAKNEKGLGVLFRDGLALRIMGRPAGDVIGRRRRVEQMRPGIDRDGAIAAMNVALQLGTGFVAAHADAIPAVLDPGGGESGSHSHVMLPGAGRRVSCGSANAGPRRFHPDP